MLNNLGHKAEVHETQSKQSLREMGQTTAFVISTSKQRKALEALQSASSASKDLKKSNSTQILADTSRPKWHPQQTILSQTSGTESPAKTLSNKGQPRSGLSKLKKAIL